MSTVCADKNSVHNGDENKNPEPPETKEQPRNQVTSETHERLQPTSGPGPLM